MKKAIITTLAATLLAIYANAASLTEGLDYKVRLGYNIGGTSPLGMPATIRSLNSYKLQPNFLLGFDVQKNISGKFGLLAGLHYESKGMEVDATVKNYRTKMVQGIDEIEGVFTGDNTTEVEMQMLTIPVLATYTISSHLLLKLGPYVSYLSTHNFKGYAHDGHIRRGDPTGEYIEIGSDESTRGDYNFSGDMRRLHYGIDLGLDWNIHSRWGIYADLEWGLNGIHKSDFNTIEQTLYPIYGSIGVTYRLK